MKRVDDRLPHPAVLSEFPLNMAVRLFAPGDVRATAAQRAAYREFAQAGDPLADDVVAMMRRLPTGEGRRLFEIALEQGIAAVPNPPTELVAFFAQVDTVPAWLDTARVERAAHVAMRTGFWGPAVALPMLALMGGYLAFRIDKTLTATGNLENMAPRRLAETASWWVAVTSPGGLERFSYGFKATLRVRLMHALVRAGINRTPDWNYDEWDQPLNQAQMAATLTTFSMANTVGCQLLGLRFAKKDREATYHVWRYVGHLLGIDPSLVPTDEHDSWRLFWLAAETEFQPDADARRLGDALVKAMGPWLIDGDAPFATIRRRLLTRYLCAYSRQALGTGNAEALGLPEDKVFAALIAATVAVNTVTELACGVVPGGRGLQARLGQRMRTRVIERSAVTHHADRTYGQHDRFAGTAARRAG